MHSFKLQQLLTEMETADIVGVTVLIAVMKLIGMIVPLTSFCGVYRF